MLVIYFTNLTALNTYYNIYIYNIIYYIYIYLYNILAPKYIPVKTDKCVRPLVPSPCISYTSFVAWSPDLCLLNHAGVLSVYLSC